MEVVPPRLDKDRERAVQIHEKIVQGMLLHTHPSRMLAEYIVQIAEEATIRALDATIQQMSSLVRKAMVARVTELGDKLAMREML